MSPDFFQDKDTVGAVKVVLSNSSDPCLKWKKVVRVCLHKSFIIRKSSFTVVRTTWVLVLST